jgi:bud site selection protein 31
VHDRCTWQILDDYAKKMRDAENESHEGKRKAESLWPIMRISHTRSRYIYELYYKREAISKELYDWLLKEGYADAKSVPAPVILSRTSHHAGTQPHRKVEEDWVRETVLRSLHTVQGYWICASSRCTMLIDGQDMNYQGSTCICRVPKAQLREGTVVECVHCGMCSCCHDFALHLMCTQDAVDVVQTPEVKNSGA